MYQTCYKSYMGKNRKSYLEHLGEQKLLLCPFSNLNYINKLLKLKIKGGELFKKCHWNRNHDIRKLQSIVSEYRDNASLL